VAVICIGWTKKTPAANRGNMGDLFGGFSSGALLPLVAAGSIG